MRKIQRWRYYCDFCKKAGGSAGHMAKHETGCTNNPVYEQRLDELLDSALKQADPDQPPEIHDGRFSP